MSRILVIEDEPDILDNITDTLEAEGYDTHGTGDGMAGLQYVVEHEPDLIICDVMIPQLDGYEVLQALREKPATALIPFIFLTALGDRTHMRQGMTMGADDYIPKPFTQAELLDAVSAQINRQSPITALHEKIKELAESEQYKSDMIRLAAHDLKNPLAAISLTTQSIKQFHGESLDERLITAIDRIEIAASQMTSLTGEVLSVERIEESLKQAHLSVFNLCDLVASTFEEFKTPAAENSQTFRLALDPASLFVEGEQLHLREVLRNLIGNALKYTPPKGKIVVRLKEQDGQAKFVVIDNGYGIEQEHQTRLFEPFFRSTSETTAHIEGTGLGLYMVKRIVERHNGKLIFQSVLGKGSKFGFTLPLVDSTPM